MPNPEEVAQLRVGDQTFEDWQTVWVQHRWTEGWPLFRFTSAEGSPVSIWTSLQFKPGDSCEIILGGQLAITGIITVRQTSYDAKNHVVELSGVGRTWAGSTSSVDSKDGNFDNMTLKQIADKVFAPFGVAVKQIGTVDEKPFEHVQVHPGELCFDFVDKLARTKGAILGSDHLGNLLLIGDHSNQVEQNLTEGENILKMQCIISNEMLAQTYSVMGQAPNGNQLSASEAANMEARAPGTVQKYYKFIQTVMEQPVKDISDVWTRAYFEARFREGTLIRAFVTVQGWLRDSGNLWRTGDDVMVFAPMAMLNGMILKIQTATFSQDNDNGTTTVLELVLPWLLGDKPYGLAPARAYPQGEDPVNPAPPAPPKITSNQPAS